MRSAPNWLCTKWHNKWFNNSLKLSAWYMVILNNWFAYETTLRVHWLRADIALSVLQGGKHIYGSTPFAQKTQNRKTKIIRAEKYFLRFDPRATAWKAQTAGCGRATPPHSTRFVQIYTPSIRTLSHRTNHWQLVHLGFIMCLCVCIENVSILITKVW